MVTPTSPLYERSARAVLTKTLRVKKGDNVIVETWTETLPWARAFVAEARRLGANPLLLYEDEEAFWEALRKGEGKHTGRVGSHEWAALQKAAAYVFFAGPAEWPRFDQVPERKMAGVAAYNGDWYQRAGAAKVRGARLYLGRTSALAAARWKVDLAQWREELVRGSLYPPEKMHSQGLRVGERLRKGRHVRIRHANGTDLSFRLRGYPLQLDDALVDETDLRAKNNMASIPGGVVGVATDHTSASGTVIGNHTNYPDSGPVTGSRWEFRDGHLTRQTYASGGGAVLKQYARAPPKGRDRLGYFSIGLNPELTTCPQMEDQELGAVLLALGGNQFRGGSNPSPFFSWLVLKGADVSVDGRPLLRRGRILG